MYEQVFENDYAALKPEQAKATKEGERDRTQRATVGGSDRPVHCIPTDINSHPLIRSQPARGRCYVICFNPAHNLTIANLTTAPYSAATHIVPIIQVWQETYAKIPRENPFVSHIQIFENKGSAMGCSNPHPHGQVWSLDYVPEEPAKALASQYKYSQAKENEREGEPRSRTGRPSLLLTYAAWEVAQKGQPRTVAINEDWIALVPYWAVWPFEVRLPHELSMRGSSLN